MIEQNEVIVATVTIILELKLLRGLSTVGHIEDVVVSRDYRGKGLAKQMIQYCMAFCQSHHCYKIILNCKNDLMLFYQKFGFDSKNVQMSIYYNE